MKGNSEITNKWNLKGQSEPKFNLQRDFLDDGNSYWDIKKQFGFNILSWILVISLAFRHICPFADLDAFSKLKENTSIPCLCLWISRFKFHLIFDCLLYFINCTFHFPIWNSSMLIFFLPMWSTYILTIRLWRVILLRLLKFIVAISYIG